MLRDILYTIGRLVLAYPLATLAVLFFGALYFGLIDLAMRLLP